MEGFGGYTKKIRLLNKVQGIISGKNDAFISRYLREK